MGSAAPSRNFVSDPIVDDRPRLPKRIGGSKAGEEAVDRAEVVESVRNIGLPGPANFKDVTASAECDGDGIGDGSPYFVWPSYKGRSSGESRAFAVARDRVGEVDVPALVDARGVVLDFGTESGGGIFTGTGNSDPLFFFL